MPGRYLRDASPCLQFIGDLSACPPADGTARFRRREAGQSRHLSALFHRKFGDRSWSRGILQALGKVHWHLSTLLRIDLLPPRPAIPPQTHGIHIDVQLARDLSIRCALRRCQDDARSQHDLLFTSITPRQSRQFFPLFLTQLNRCGSLWHGCGDLLTLFLPFYHGFFKASMY